MSENTTDTTPVGDMSTETDTLSTGVDKKGTHSAGASEGSDLRSDPADSTDTPEIPEDKPDPAARDVAKYRKRAQAAEKERDQLAERLTAMQRAEAERLAANHLGDGGDLWSAGTELDALLDDGTLSADLVDQAVQQVLEKHPHWRKPAKPAPPASLVTGDGKITGDQKPSFVDAFAPRR